MTTDPTWPQPRMIPITLSSPSPPPSLSLLSSMPHGLPATRCLPATHQVGHPSGHRGPLKAHLFSPTPTYPLSLAPPPSTHGVGGLGQLQGQRNPSF